MKKLYKSFIFIFALCVLSAQGLAAATLYKTGVTASYYADKFHGRKTSSGEIFNMYAYTAAHKTLPFGTMLRVTNLANGNSVNVKVNDRGPFVEGRELDLSKAAAVKLDMVKTGTAKVKIEVLGKDEEANSGAASAKSQEIIVKSSDSADEKLYDIQLGSFSSRSNAENFAQELLRKGFKNVAYQTTKETTRVCLIKVKAEDVRQLQYELRENGFTQQLVRVRTR